MYSYNGLRCQIDNDVQLLPLPLPLSSSSSGYWRIYKSDVRELFLSNDSITSSPHSFIVNTQPSRQITYRSLQPVPYENGKAFGREKDHHLKEGVHKYEEVIFVHIPKTAG